MEGNGLGVSNSFSFLMFEYAADNTGVNPGIYLHCKVQLYPKEPSSIPVSRSGGNTEFKL